MYAWKQLQISKSRCLRMQFLWKIRIQAFQLKRIILQKPHHILFVFFFCNGAGTEDQFSSWLHIVGCTVQNGSLQDYDFLLFLRSNPDYDLRFLADDAIAGAGNICDHNVCQQL